MITNQKKLILIAIEIFLNHNKNLLVCLSVILSSEVLIISLLCCSQYVVGSHSRQGPETQAWPILDSYSSSHSDWPKAGHVTQADPIRVLAVFDTRKLRGRCSFSLLRLLAMFRSDMRSKFGMGGWRDCV